MSHTDLPPRLMRQRARAHVGPAIDCGSPEANAEKEVATFGFWVFMMSDAVLFAVLFATFGAMIVGTDGGPGLSDVTSIERAFVMTMVLLASSLTSGFVSVALDRREGRRAVLLWLGATLALGVLFVGLEAIEVRGLLSEGASPQRSGFLSAFFVLIGTHGLHVSLGVLWGAILAAQVATLGLDARVTSRLVRFTLYWHFLDIVWIGIMTFVYLAGSL